MTGVDLAAVLSLTIAFAVYISWCCSSYRISKYQFLDKSPEMSFEKFLFLYHLSPDRWELCDDYVIYNENPICFSRYRDFRKYVRWNMKLRRAAMKESDQLRKAQNSQKKKDIESDWDRILRESDSNWQEHQANGET